MTKSNEFFNFLEKLASGLQLFQSDAKVGIQICADTRRTTKQRRLARRVHHVGPEQEARSTVPNR